MTIDLARLAALADAAQAAISGEPGTISADAAVWTMHGALDPATVKALIECAERAVALVAFMNDEDDFDADHEKAIWDALRAARAPFVKD